MDKTHINYLITASHSKCLQRKFASSDSQLVEFLSDSQVP